MLAHEVQPPSGKTCLQKAKAVVIAPGVSYYTREGAAVVGTKVQV